MILSPCRPPFWAPSGHAQTLVGYFLPSGGPSEKGERIEIALSDGDRLVGRVLAGTSNLVVYLFHGLSGSTDSGYIRRIAKLCVDAGHSVIMMNHRGCGEGAGLAKHPYHSGRAEDLSSAIEEGRRRFPKHKHLAIGFSLSGNALLLLLSGQRGTTKPDYAISVNAPIDLQTASRALMTGFNRIYDLHFVLQCRREIAQRLSKEEIKKYKLSGLTTVYDFDDAYTGPASGFTGRDDYYRQCSTQNLLTQITTPTVLLTAEDDPFVYFEAYKKAKLSSSVHLHAEKHGGHVGYVSSSKTPLDDHRWMDYALLKFVEELTRR